MIYLLEDDDSIRDFVIYTLNSQGMEARGFGLPSEFWNAMADQVPSLVLLDVMLPEEDGLSVLKKLRSAVRTAKLPIIMLTAKGTPGRQQGPPPPSQISCCSLIISLNCRPSFSAALRQRIIRCMKISK